MCKFEIAINAPVSKKKIYAQKYGVLSGVSKQELTHGVFN